jgi:branched-chain amino acid transport system substrate-binding protein
VGDDIQGPAAASFLFNDLGVRRLLVIDDTAFRREIADSVGAAFVKLGGKVIRRSLNPGAPPSTVIGPLSLATHPATGVFFGGFADTGAPQVRKAMVASGFAKLPFVSWDGIGGSGSEAGSFLQLTRRAAVGSYQSHASIAPSKAAFVDAYRSRFGREPDEYTASAYACTEVILDALRKVAAKGATAAGLREAVRSQAVDPDHQYDTALGSIGFDANGDSLQQFVTFYRVDPSADDGNGDWVIAKQQDYGPAP